MRFVSTALVAVSFFALGAVAQPFVFAAERSEPKTETQQLPQVGPNGKKLYYFMVFSNAKPGAQEEFDRWYDVIHAPVIIESGDFVWSQRFDLSPEQFGGVSSQFPKRQSLVIFAAESNKIADVIADTERRVRKPRNISSKSMDYRSLLGVTYVASGPKITQKQAKRILAKETAAGRIPGPEVEGPPDIPEDLKPPQDM